MLARWCCYFASKVRTPSQPAPLTNLLDAVVLLASFSGFVLQVEDTKAFANRVQRAMAQTLNLSSMELLEEAEIPDEVRARNSCNTGMSFMHIHVNLFYVHTWCVSEIYQNARVLSLASRPPSRYNARSELLQDTIQKLLQQDLYKTLSKNCYKNIPKPLQDNIQKLLQDPQTVKYMKTPRTVTIFPSQSSLPISARFLIRMVRSSLLLSCRGRGAV